jgi:hypothetical protein
VTPTVSMLSPDGWLISLRLDIPEFLDLECWLSSMTTVLFGCGVAPMWPRPIRDQYPERPERTVHIQADASAMRAHRPSTMSEIFRSHGPRHRRPILMVRFTTHPLFPYSVKPRRCDEGLLDESAGIEVPDCVANVLFD